MKNKLSLIYKVLIIIISFIGIFLNFKLIPFNKAIAYFTIQSNIFCFLFFLIIVVLRLIKKGKKNNIYYIFKGMVTMSITITMFIFQLVISTNSLGVYEGHLVECYLVHIVVPLLVIFDYIIFGEKGNLKKHYPFIWSLILIYYMIFSFVYTALGGVYINGSKYPYFYMDVTVYGNFGVLRNCSIVYVAYVLYGIIIQRLDKRLSLENKK